MPTMTTVPGAAIDVADPSSSATAPPRWSRVALALAAWGAASAAVAYGGLLAHVPRPLVPLALVGSVGLFVLGWRRGGVARAIADHLPLRLAVGYHIVRAPIGAAFLVAHAHGALPGSFAIAAGVGDIVAGLLAIPAMLTTSRRLVLAWNVLALLDILMVLSRGIPTIALGDAAAAAPFLRAPFPMLPTFVVPLVLITHLIVFARLRAARPAAS
jgi:hypothetical protein